MRLATTLLCGLCISTWVAGLAALENRHVNPWTRARSPSRGPARVIGAPGAGCIQGASHLAPEGHGYRVMRPERRRGFGHPHLVDFVKSFAAKVADDGLAPVGVGDLGQARGGPASSGHASHQNGLDVDIWFTAGLPRAEAQDVVDEKSRTAFWSERVPRLLELAASDPRVDRIFVGAVIKREICEQTTGDRSWLHKVRPWWGHRAHFHVRLACPDDSPLCSSQRPLPAGDGCEEVAWWLSERTEQDRAEGASQYSNRVGAVPELPKTCAKLLE